MLVKYLLIVEGRKGGGWADPVGGVDPISSPVALFTLRTEQHLGICVTSKRCAIHARNCGFQPCGRASVPVPTLRGRIVYLLTTPGSISCPIMCTRRKSLHLSLAKYLKNESNTVSNTVGFAVETCFSQRMALSELEVRNARSRAECC